MNFVEPSATLIVEQDPYKKIELAGRTCYKSEAKITDDSAKKFVQNLIKNGHTAMLEHCTFVFLLQYEQAGKQEATEYVSFLKEDAFLSVTETVRYTYGKDEQYIRVLVSGNLRAICQRGVSDPIYRALENRYEGLAYGAEGTEIYRSVEALIMTPQEFSEFADVGVEERASHTYHTLRLVTDRGVTHELVRHRLASFAQESTRYVNYRDGISICLPDGFYEKSEEVQSEYTQAFWDAELAYERLINLGEKPQQARAVLPTALKTEIVVTANFDEWRHILSLRYFGTTGAPHPDIKALMGKVVEALENHWI